MSETPRLRWTKGLVSLSLPLVLGIAIVLLIVIAATLMM